MSYWKIIKKEDISYNKEEEVFEVYSGFDSEGNRYVEIPKKLILDIIEKEEIESTNFLTSDSAPLVSGTHFPEIQEKIKI